MMTNRIKVLGIAPYASMKALMANTAKQFPDIELTVYVGDLEKGAQIVKDSTDNYDVIISRGGTAQLISKFSTIPVMDISISVYDILRAVKLADNYGQKYAIVGFPSITDSASILCDLLQYKITLITIHSSDETMGILKKLQKDGYKMLLGDNIVTSYAKELGLNSLLITSGTESISAVFKRAIAFCQGFAGIRTELSVIRSSFKGQSSSTLILDENCETVFSCFNTDALDTASDITYKLKEEMQNCLRKEKKKFFINISNQIFSVSSYSYNDYGKNYVAFHIWGSEVPITATRKGIKVLNSSQLDETNSLFENITSNQELISRVRKMDQYTTPVVLLGENGTGKSHLASIIHLNSPLKNNPFIEIDCSILTSKNWDYLTGNYNSPFLDADNTLYLRNVNYLNKDQTNRLASLILDSNLCGRNRVLFSYNTARNASTATDFYDFINTFTCITLSLSPLRNHITDIPNIANLYLSSLNMELGKGFVGFEPEALDLMQNYAWPYNLTQFKRVLHEIALLTDGAYITSDIVLKCLSKEPADNHFMTSPISKGDYIKKNHSKTLNQLNREIILSSLSSNNGNQTRTAKELGISRSTLWRYLNGK
ncbi:sigma-54-dependent transcriptional regulator [Clostridiales bacterium TF09-2AC]|nr:sigma-54-dependent transcriptional regulator [Clostridiales bacterium TF09-2AC]